MNFIYAQKQQIINKNYQLKFLETFFYINYNYKLNSKYAHWNKAVHLKE